jgi:hypothetical protein
VKERIVMSTPIPEEVTMRAAAGSDDLQRPAKGPRRAGDGAAGMRANLRALDLPPMSARDSRHPKGETEMRCAGTPARQYLAVVVVMLAVLATQAAALEAKKVDDLVELSRGIPVSCPLLQSSLVVGNRRLADGTDIPGFTIPKGHVLVITDVHFEGITAATGNEAVFALARVSTASANVIVNGRTTAFPSGAATAILSLRAGASVQAGQTLCVGAVDVTANSFIDNPTVAVYGFLTHE